jgi:hypothetical protein
VLKKKTLDSDDFANYRPISNLSFISKTLERIISNQLNDYLTTNHLYAKMQSAYRKNHSTETALIRVINDITIAIDNHQEAILVLLDLSSAFDTIDHQILLERLQTHFGLTGKVLSWVKSYITDRPQRVLLDSTYSKSRYLTCGVPQSSVLGSLLFSLYLSPLEDIISLNTP